MLVAVPTFGGFVLKRSCVAGPTGGGAGGAGGAGAAAVGVNVTLFPFSVVAVIVAGPALDPRRAVMDASPCASVLDVATSTVAFVVVHVTVAAATGNPLMSATLTTRRSVSALPVSAVCALPET